VQNYPHEVAVWVGRPVSRLRFFGEEERTWSKSATPPLAPDVVGDGLLVPVIDLSDLAAPETARRRAVAAAIDEACCSVGFFQVVSHGVAGPTISAMLDAVDSFFALPIEDRLACRPPRASVNRGYAPVSSESLAYSLGREAPPDLFEAFNVGPDTVPDLPVYRDADETCFAPNLWPTDLPGFREALVGYFRSTAALAHRLTSAFALALGLDGAFFESKTDHSTDMMRVNLYSIAPGEEPLPGQMGMGPHTDYGIVTVLYADPVRGLQIIGPDGDWHDVVPVHGAFLVNLGDLLANWTNDRWRSTVHRVLPPQRSGTVAVRRRSVAFFHDGNYDALIECLPSCTSAESPPRYPPVRAGEHLKAKLLGPRALTPSSATSTLGDRSVPL
jgi:isopenicillin N synthase-like dioxygenase